MQVPHVGQEFQLSGAGPAEYHFVLPDLYDALPWDVKRSSAVGLVLSTASGEEPFLKNVLRFTSECDFSLLCTVAEALRIEKPKRYTRAELLTAAAQTFGRLYKIYTYA